MNEPLASSDARQVRGWPALSVRVHFLLLIAAVVVPLLSFGTYIFNRHVAGECDRLAESARELARHVALILDSEFVGFVSLLNGLAASTALQAGDFRQFHSEATRLVAGKDQLIVLRDFEVTQYLNTQVPFGGALPPAVPMTETEKGVQRRR